MSAARPTTLAELTLSDEADLEVVMPWTGPVIREDGSLDPDMLPEKFYVATSAGWPKDDVAEEATALNAGILATIMQLDGMLATSVAISPGNWNVARNLVVWRDASALRQFLDTPAHRAAAERTRDLMFDWEGVGWVSTRDAGLPDFAEARARLDAARPATSAYASFD
jgi:quinol monooxygenase YgiN